MSEGKPKVFISHSWEDNKISRKLAEYLKRDGAEIWIDYARISGGQNLPVVISEALEWCDTLVLLWSKSAENSYYVNLEWTSALDLKKNIIPCLVDNTKRPAILHGFLYIEFKDIESGYISLAHALNLVIKEKKQEIITKKESEKTKAKPVLEKPRGVISSPPFRARATQLSETDVIEMLKKYDFFDNRKNKTGHGFDNQYEVQTIGDDKIVIDKASGLIWQQSGSFVPVRYEVVKRWIHGRKGKAGFHDWHLPTLEEAMSLMEPEQKLASIHGDLYIDPVFDDKERWIWTSDQMKGESRTAWVVNFNTGDCYWVKVDYYNYFMRAVRSGHSSSE